MIEYGSAHIVLARDGRRVAGFVTALSDGVLSACDPELEPFYARFGMVPLGGMAIRR